MPQGPGLEGFHCIYMYMYVFLLVHNYDDIVLFLQQKIM